MVRRDRLGGIRRVAGVDVAFADRGATTCAAVVVMSWPGMEVVDEARAQRATSFPYVPGLLSFRELPAVLAAFEQLRARPDLLLCDGQGIAHPRRFGIACHLGVWLDLPAIGVGKSRLVGTFTEPGRARGERSPLMDGDELLGAVLRTRAGVKPLFVSPGHRVSIDTAVHWVLECAPRFRLPEPIRAADRLAAAG